MSGSGVSKEKGPGAPFGEGPAGVDSRFVSGCQHLASQQ